MSQAKYAQRTTVPVNSTRNEIEAVLRKYGADAFAYLHDGSSAVIAFRMADRQFKFILPMPDLNDRQFTHSQQGVRKPAATQTLWEQACRSRWRSLLLIIKAKLEAVANGVTTLEDEFLAQTVMPDGSTFGQVARDKIAIAYQTGVLPTNLLLSGPSQ